MCINRQFEGGALGSEFKDPSYKELWIRNLLVPSFLLQIVKNQSTLHKCGRLDVNKVKFNITFFKEL